MSRNTKHQKQMTKRITKKKKVSDDVKKNDRVWMFRKDNLVICYRTPLLRIQTAKVGGADDDEVENEEAKELIERIKDEMKNSQIGYTEKDYESVEQLLNRKDMCNIPGKLSSMATSAFQTLNNGAISLGQFLTPTSSNEPRSNQNTIRVLWFPRSHLHYKRGNSTARDKKNFKMGDLVVYVEPEKYANTSAYLSGMFGSVEDVFNDVINGRRVPKREHIIKTVSHQPQLDFEEYTAGPIEPKKAIKKQIKTK